MEVVVELCARRASIASTDNASQALSKNALDVSLAVENGHDSEGSGVGAVDDFGKVLSGLRGEAEFLHAL